MITRKIGKILRGNATPAQLMLATCLGAMLGFMPGWSQAAGSIILLLMLLAVLNANLWITGLTALLAKAVSIPMMPLTFGIGRALLDGPTTGIFQPLINAPVTALLGLEYYVVTGGLMLGLGMGLILGILLIKSVRGYRQKMATLQEGSEAYAKWSSKRSVKILTWLLMGKGPKKSYEELAQLKGKAIRWVGVIAVVLFVVLLGVVRLFFTDQIVTHYMITGLEDANGATVDIANASVDLTEGRMTIDKLAMADPNALDTDLLRAEKITINISANDLLRKRITLDEVTVIDGSTGEKRAVKGALVGKPAKASTPPTTSGEGKTIDDYLKDAQKWKDRLAQVRQWLEKVSQPAGSQTGEKPTTLKEKLKQQIQQLGYARVYAAHLITDTPTLTVTKLTAGKVKVAQLPDQTLDIHATNLSTNGNLLSESTKLDITSSKGTLLLNLAMPNKSDAPGSLKFVGKGFNTDAVASNLKVAGNTPLSGGTFDVNLDGKLTNAAGTMSLDCPLNVTLHDSTINIGGKAQKVSTLSLPIALKGPIDNPAITVDGKALQKALADAGINALKDKATEKAKEKINDAVGDKLKDGIGNLLGK